MLSAVEFVPPTPPDGALIGEADVAVGTDLTDHHYAFIDWAGDAGLWMGMDAVDGSGNPTDSSTHAHSAIAEGDAHQVAGGKFGSAFEFDGAGDYVNLGDPDALDFTNTDDFSLSVWVYKTDGTNQSGVINKGNNSVRYSLFYHGSGRWQFDIADNGSGSGYVYAAEPDPANRWIHLVATFDASRQRLSLYVDGEFKMKADAELGDFANDLDLKIGGFRYAGAPDFQGRIDDVLIVNRLLNEFEIAALYDARTQGPSHSFSQEGVYTYQGCAADSTGTEYRTETRTVTLDALHAVPDVLLDRPVDGRWHSSDTVAFSWQVGSTLDTSFTCDLLIDGEAALSGLAVQRDVPFSTQVSGVSDGTHTWSVRATDTYDNTGVSEVRAFHVDTADPTLSVTSPPGPVWTASDDVPVSATVGSAGAAYGFINWDDSLLGWWTGDDLTRDESGRGNDARLMGDAELTTDGKFGNAFEFDGDGDYLTLSAAGEHASIDHNPDFDFREDDSFTLSAWVYKLNRNEETILQKNTWRLRYHGAQRWQVSVGGLHAWYPDPAPTNRWAHIAAVYDAPAGRVTLYVDGQARYDGTGTAAGELCTRTPLSIGKTNWDGRYWTGKIDEVMIFGRALSAGEMAFLYNAVANPISRTFDNLTELAPHTYEVVAVNHNANHLSSGVAPVQVDQPDTPPAVTLTGPLGETRSDSSTQTFTFSATDTNDEANTTLTSATFYWDGAPGGWGPDGTVSLSGESDAGSFLKTGVPDGTYEWNVYVTDSNGNGAFAGQNHTLVIGPTEYYVATDGDDGDDGSFAAPFQTIQHAADLARPGDTIYVRGGTYRETVTPARSGNELAEITFRAYPGETVVVSGAEPLSGWTQHDGSIYRATMPVDLGKGENQVFVDGTMMLWARWPNTPDLDVMRPVLSDIESGTGDTSTWIYTVNDSALTQPTDYWVGAVIHCTYSPKYWTHTGDVISSDVGTLTFQGHDHGDDRYPAGGQYYLTGTYVALDSAGEWYYDSAAGRIYLWVPGDDDPDNHTVEVKARENAFDLRGRSYVTVEGFDLFAARIVTDDDSHHVTLDGLDASYVEHFTLLGDRPLDFGNDDTGIILDGHHNVLTDTEIRFSAGNGVSLIGDDCAVQDSTIHDVNYMGIYCGTINTGKNRTRNNVITRNTLYNSGRDVVQHSGAENLKITYNHIYNTNVGNLTGDLGCTYAIATNYMGTEIAYNVVHDSGYSYAGIYLDGYGENAWVHHNVVYDVRYAILLNSPIAFTIDHNTADPISGYRSLAGSPDPSIPEELNRMVFRNNIFTGDAAPYGDGTTWEGNIEEGTAPRFVNAAGGDYQLLWDSPAIDAGPDLGYGGDAAGNPIYGLPDTGALEYQPPYVLGTDAIAAAAEVRIYGDGAFRYLTAPGATAAALAVTPSAGWGAFAPQDARPFWMDLDVANWTTAGAAYCRWVEVAAALAPTEASAYTLDGFEPDATYLVRVDGALDAALSGPAVSDSVVRADSAGQLAFAYTGDHEGTVFELGPIAAGDADRDGDVDLDDLGVLAGNYGEAGGWTSGDFDYDDDIDLDDLGLLAGNYDSGAGGTASVSTGTEPAALTATSESLSTRPAEDQPRAANQAAGTRPIGAQAIGQPGQTYSAAAGDPVPSGATDAIRSAAGMEAPVPWGFEPAGIRADVLLRTALSAASDGHTPPVAEDALADLAPLELDPLVL